MAKKTKEAINLDEIDENFIISSFKTTGKAAETADAKGSAAEAVENREQPATQAKENREPGKGRKRGQSEYGEKFLKRNELKTRQCVYISGQIHGVISRLVHVIADKDITVGGYIDTVLTEHLESHKDEINELYRQKREDLI